MTREDDKLRGGYYTPKTTASFISKWGICTKGDRVLEPSCGDGSIMGAAAERLRSLGASPKNVREQILGVELVEEEADKARQTGAAVICCDFFSCCVQGGIGREYDAIIGNPPFIRYQDFREEFREHAFALMREYGFNPNRLTNIWVPFLAISAHRLSPSGRLAMVIPAELFQVNYARETREFLLNYFESVTLITFRELLFKDAQQEVILLLAERKSSGSTRGIRLIEIDNEASLAQFDTLESINSLPQCNRLPSDMKWQGYYLNPDVLSLAGEILASPSVKKVSDIAEVNVGLVSGQNSFFVISEPEARRCGILDSCKPIVSRSLQLDGLAFTHEDMHAQEALGRNVLLFAPDTQLTATDKRYIAEGEKLGHNKNYKCRIRNPWYMVPMSWEPDAFFYRQAGAYPRIVLNSTEALNTDTLHKVRFKEGISGESAVLCFNNTLTFLMSELMGRSYGGGVLTFEPSEARNLPIPYMGTVELDFKHADDLARKGAVEQLLDYVDEIVLREQMGLEQADIHLLREAWKRLRDKRLARKRK